MSVVEENTHPEEATQRKLLSTNRNYEKQTSNKNKQTITGLFRTTQSRRRKK